MVVCVVVLRCMRVSVRVWCAVDRGLTHSRNSHLRRDSQKAAV